jgi:hypothetical protein
MSEKIQVHEIGNYKISIAMSINELLNNIDWNKFKKPSNYEKRISTFTNKNLYPTEYEYFYVVASAIKNIEDDGFGIVYPKTNTETYFPTAHEDTSKTHYFDVEIYNFGNDLSKNTKYNKILMESVLDKLQNIRIKLLDNTYNNITFDKDINCFYYKEEKELMKNHNLFLD